MSALTSSFKNVTGNGNGSTGSTGATHTAPRGPKASNQPAAAAANPEEGKKLVKYAYGSQIGDDTYEVFATGKISSELADFIIAVMAKSPSLQKEIYTAYERKFSKKPVRKFIDPSKGTDDIKKVYDNYDDAESAGISSPRKAWLYDLGGSYEFITFETELPK